jgi:hypothetical protein
VAQFYVSTGGSLLMSTWLSFIWTFATLVQFPGNSSRSPKNCAGSWPTRSGEWRGITIFDIKYTFKLSAKHFRVNSSARRKLLKDNIPIISQITCFCSCL